MGVIIITLEKYILPEIGGMHLGELSLGGSIRPIYIGGRGPDKTMHENTWALVIHLYFHLHIHIFLKFSLT